MIQKILKVGTSAAVTLSKHSLEELGVGIGDTVTLTVHAAQKKVVIEPVASVDKELVQWTRKFIERYRPALESLAKK